MSTIPFTILDVFAEKRYAGNQLAVFRQAAGLSAPEMLCLAREINFSESAFILSDKPRNGGWDVRIFTPAQEVPFAGHPTLGTAWLIREEIAGRLLPEITLHLQVGSIPVSFGEEADGSILWMQQASPVFGQELPREAVAPVLGLDPGELDERFPVLEVSTGLPFFIVPVRRLESVRRCRPDVEACLRLTSGTLAKAFLVFTPETEDPASQIHARVFTHYYNIPEDPATGSANGCLAAWLCRHGFTGSSSVDLAVEQGLEIGRPSRLYLQAEEKPGTIQVRVGGRVFRVAGGQWDITKS